MISSRPEISSKAQFTKGRTETLYGVKRKMNLRLGAGLRAFHAAGVKQNNDISASTSVTVFILLSMDPQATRC